MRPPPLQFSRLAKRLFRQTGWFCSLGAALLGAGNKLLPGPLRVRLGSAQNTAAILTDVFDFREVAREGSVTRFVAAGDVKDSAISTKPRQLREDSRDAVQYITWPFVLPTTRNSANGREVDPCARKTSDRTEGSQIFPFDLLPRAGWCSVRDCDRCPPGSRSTSRSKPSVEI